MEHSVSSVASPPLLLGRHAKSDGALQSGYSREMSIWVAQPRVMPLAVRT